MPNNRVPKARLSTGTAIVKPSFAAPDDSIVFSFNSLETTEYFNLDCTCENWSSDLIDMMKGISGISKTTLLSRNYRTYRVHNHEGAKPPNPLPEGVALKDLYQLRISTSKGGIHGVFYENIFYVIWLDPLHNMYPDSRYGGLRSIKPPTTCCMERDTLIGDIQRENAELKEEIKMWEEESEKR